MAKIHGEAITKKEADFIMKFCKKTENTCAMNKTNQQKYLQFSIVCFLLYAFASMITISTVSWFALYLLHVASFRCGVILVSWMALCRNERCTKCLAVKNIFDERWHCFLFLFRLVHEKKRTGKRHIGNCVSSLYYKRADTVAPIYRWTNNFNGIRYSVIVGLFDSFI